MMDGRAIASAALVAAICGAQPSGRLRFDVVSIKPADPGTPPYFQGGPGSSDPGRASYTRATPADLIGDALNVPKGRISGPSWLDSEYFAVTVAMPPATTLAEYRQMMQALLVERFHLAFHRETKEDRGYELRVGEKGLKLTRSTLSAEDEQATGCVRRNERELTQFKLTVTNYTMGAFAGFLATLLGGPGSIANGGVYRAGQPRPEPTFVVDKTGLPGKYSFQFEFDPELAGLPAALESKLGLRLVETKVPREHIVVDHLDQMPTDD